MKQIFILFFLALAYSATAQNASTGVQLGFYYDDDNDSGALITGNVRTQFSKRFGWQTDLGFGSEFEKRTITTERITTIGNTTTIETTTIDKVNHIAFLRSSITAKVFDLNGLYGEFILGAGILKKSSFIEGIGHAKFLLSAKLTEKVVIGIPLSYNVVFWNGDTFYSGGISLRYHY